MTDTAAPTTAGPSSRSGRAGLVVLAVTGALVAVGVVAALHRIDAPDGGSGDGFGVAAVVVAVLAVAGLVAIGGVRDPGVPVAAVGTLVVVAGSGVARWAEEETFEGSVGGDVVARADVLWPVVAVGVVVVAAGVGLSLRRSGISRGRAGVVGLAVQAAGMVVLAATMGEIVVGQWIEGRPRRRRGRLVPSPHRSASTAGCVGDVWARAAVDEEAAVRAFRDLADRLTGVGAPADLVARSRAAAADEVRHARQCRRLARLHGAPASTFVRNRATEDELRTEVALRRTVELVRLAVESHVDGVVGEGMAAARLERGAATAPDLAPTLLAIARDERSHAALGADIVRWCATQRPLLVALAVDAAARRLPAPTALPEAHAAHDDATLRAAGLVDRTWVGVP